MERRQMKLRYLFISMLILNSVVFSHNEFYTAQGGVSVVTTYPDITTDKNLLLKWSSSQRTSIPVNIMLDAAHALPGTLSQSTTYTQFLDAYNTWHNYAPSNIGFVENGNITQSCTISFNNSASVFGGPTAAQTAGGVTPAASANYNIIPYGTSQTEFGATAIYFNNTTEFTSGIQGKRWTNLNVSSYPNDGQNYFNFQSAALHEIGHLLGLAHCEISNSSIVMRPLDIRQLRLELDQNDKDGLTTLYSLPTGVEDALEITSASTPITQNSQVYYGAYFYDYPPSGNYIVGNFSWSLVVKHMEGEYIAATGSTLPYNGWLFTFGTLPDGYFWLRGPSNNVFAEVRVSGVDNVNVFHSAKFDILISGVANGTSSGTLSHNEIWGGEPLITGNVNVPVGITLKILAGTIVRFAAGKSLTVNGVLTAGTSPLSAITFTSQSGTTPGSWGSIVLNGSSASGSSLNGVTIQYGTTVNVINASNVTISDCLILNSSTHGINFSGSSGVALNNRIENSNVYHGIVVQNGSTVWSDKNTFKKSNMNHQGAALLFSGGGTGYISRTDIRGWNWGVGAIWGSSPEFRASDYASYNPNNRITGCLLGINAYQSSWPVIGAPTNGYGGNSIYGNSPYNINFTSGGSLYAQYTYWGGGDPSGTFYTSPGSYINSNNWNPSDPWQGISLPKREDMPIAELPERTTEEGSLLQSKITQGKDINALQGDDNLFDGSNIRREHGNNAAKDFFKSYITKHSDNQAAYIELYKCYDEETAEDIIQYFSNLPPKAAKEHSLLLAYL